MLDFGELGLWSKSTLLAQSSTKYEFYHSENKITIVKSIENNYNKLNEDLDTRINKYGTEKIKKLTVSELSYNLRLFNKSTEKKNKLYEDFSKYRKALE